MSMPEIGTDATRQQYEQMLSQIITQKMSMMMQIDNKVNEQFLAIIDAKNKEIEDLKNELKNRKQQREDAKKQKSKSK